MSTKPRNNRAGKSKGFSTLADFTQTLGFTDDEQKNIEFKDATGGTPSGVWESFSAFANTKGGWIIFGIDETTKKSTGTLDIDKIQSNIASSLIDKLVPPVFPKMTVEVIDGKKIVAMYMPSAEAHQKPVYIKDKGPKRGGFKREGTSNLNLTDDDLERMYTERANLPPDSRPVEGFGLEVLDSIAIEAYRRMVDLRRSDSTLALAADLQLLQRLKAVTFRNGEWLPSRGGIALFGKNEYVSAVFPAFEIQIVYIDGTEWKTDLETRPRKTVIDGKSLVLFVPELESFIFRLIPENIKIKPERFARPSDPLRIALREAILNVLIHQDYLAHRHVQIRVFTDRLEIENAGYSKKPIDLFDELGSEPRNPVIAGAFEKAGIVEKEGTGIQTMKEAMRETGFPAPQFVSSENQNRFVVRFSWHNMVDEEDLKWAVRFADVNDDERLALIYARRNREINNEKYRSITGFSPYKTSKILTGLSTKGHLEQKGSSNQTFYVLNEGKKSASPPRPPARAGMYGLFDDPNSPEVPESPSRHMQEVIQGDMQDDIQGVMQEVMQDKRDAHAIPILHESAEPPTLAGFLPPSANPVPYSILNLCLEPKTAAELAATLNLDATYLKQHYTSKLVRGGYLEHTTKYPKTRGTRYKTTALGREIVSDS